MTMTDPDPVAWPEDCRCAVVVTVNFDAELFWRRLDPSVARRPKTQSIGAYGARRGVWRVLDALADARVAASFMVPGSLAHTYRDVLAAVAAEGHELACHGYEEERLPDLSADEQRDTIARAADAVGAISGRRPVGFRPLGQIATDTGEVLDDLGFSWCSALRGDDRPVLLPTARGVSSVVDIGQQWELQDAPYFLFNYAPAYPTGQCRIAGYARVLNDWKQEFDAYYDEGLCFVLSLDPQAIGSPGRIQLLRDLLAHIDAHEGVWWATGAEVGNWWRTVATAPPTDGAEVVRRAALAARV